MPERSEFYLSLGSNIMPERNLAAALRLLAVYGEVRAVSGVWESKAVGSDGPNFLNVCVRFDVNTDAVGLKDRVIGPVERALGRTRSGNKNASRTIDLDILMEDDHPLNVLLWEHPFVILPMAELLPDVMHPRTGRALREEAPRAAASLWMRRRPDIDLATVSTQPSDP